MSHASHTGLARNLTSANIVDKFDARRRLRHCILSCGEQRKGVLLPCVRESMIW